LENAMLVLNLPPPISVNRTRKIDWRNHKRYTTWKAWAGKLFLEQGGNRANPQIKGPYAVVIVIDPHHSHCDLDNTAKAVIDFLVSMKLVEGDGPKYLHEITVRWGETKYGSTLSVIEVAA
jgi:hypothetical protein